MLPRTKLDLQGDKDVFSVLFENTDEVNETSNCPTALVFDPIELNLGLGLRINIGKRVKDHFEIAT